MPFINKLERIFCRHNYQLFANIYGDLVHDLNARTVYICKKCGKRKYVKSYVEAPISYNGFLYDCVQYKKTGILNISPETIKNREQYNSIFGMKTLEDIWQYKLKDKEHIW